MYRARGQLRGAWTLMFAFILPGVLALFVLIPAGEAAPADPAHSIQVEIGTDRVHVKPSNSEPGVATVLGAVTIDKATALDRVVVTLDGWASNNWTVTVDPNTLTFEEPGRKGFNVTVVVPASTPCTQVSEDVAILNVLANGRSGVWHDSDETFAEIRVDQYYALSVTSYQQELKGRPGREVVGHVTVHNLGNGPDNAQVVITDGLQYFERDHFEESCGMREFNASGVSFALILRDDIDPKLYGKTVTITFRARSLGAASEGILVEEVYTITLEIQTISESVMDVPWQLYAIWTAILAPLALVIVLNIRQRKKRKETLRRIEELGGTV